MALAQIRQALPAFRSAVDGGTGDFAPAKAALGKLKLLMTELPSQQAVGADAPINPDEAAVCREVLDYAVMLSVRTNDTRGFERHVAQARMYYAAGRASEAPDAAQRRLFITGLHLMFLLVEGRLGEFHMRVETLTDEERASEAVSLPLRLETLLAEGSYNKVLAAAAALPPALALFKPLLDRLAHTVRDHFAECATASYTSLRVPDAVAMLRLSSPAELQAYIGAKELPWTPAAGTAAGAGASPAKGGPRLVLGGEQKAKPALDARGTMQAMLAYATDVERII